VQLGPVAGPLGKIPQGGRNWEGFSNDPYLAGVGMVNVWRAVIWEKHAANTFQTINGMQAAGVQACAKHYRTSYHSDLVCIIILLINNSP
jgi:beta-glucosidase